MSSAAAPVRATLDHRIIALIAFAFAVLMYWCGALQSIDLSLMDSRFRLLQRAPSDRLIVVKIDHRSIKQLVSWPWPRGYHAQVLDNLFAAGARTVAVDIDFSSPSTPTNDEALAAAFDRHAGRIILPAFKQKEATRNGPPTVSETFPNPLFRDRVQLGAVNVQAAADSRIRELPYGETFGLLHMPSLASALAGAHGDTSDRFYLDYGIRIFDTPQLSYADVLRGDFDRNDVAGKDVLIGATAVELGDYLAVPVYGTLPGPLLQALGYQSLVQHRALQRTGVIAGTAAAAFIVVLLALIAGKGNWWRLLLALGAVWAGLYAAALVIATIAPISFDVTAAGLAALVFCALGWLRELEHQARLLLQQRATDLRRRASMHRVLEDSFEGILVTDGDGIVEMANPAAGRILGIPPPHMIGMSVGSLLPISSPSNDDPVLLPLAPLEIELPGSHGEGILELVVSGSRASAGDREGEEAGAVLTYTFRDISERRRTAQALRTAMHEAQAASQSKSEFLANMSHELRTPLNAIIGFSELIRAQVFGTLPSPRYLEYADDITSSGKHLLDVINDILDMAKFEAGKLELNEDVIDLGETVQLCMRLVRGLGGANGLRFDVEVPAGLPPLRGDPRLVRQIIINVLGNAIKFTPEGGTVRVSVASVPFGLMVQVEDTGIGIPEDQIPQLGRAFHQVDSKLARSYEGTGLGLALVNAYLGLHQGELVIESMVDQGTIVSMLFPAARILADMAPSAGPGDVTAAAAI